jgi:hypothetical protein
MAVIQLIIVLAIIGVVLWALKYLTAGFIEPWIMNIITKVAVVGVVFLILFWLLGMAGIVPMPTLLSFRLGR